MTQPLYLISSCGISPQHTYDEEHFLMPPVVSDDNKLFVLDADHTRYISPVAIRRMSRILKIGITAGMACLERGNVATPDGIIIGTAHGSITDMEAFLKDMIRLEEQALNPTTFIQSTYNSVNGWIAMLSKCTGYNQAFVHRGFSLELSIFDAGMMCSETSGKQTFLVGGFDELTPEYYTIRRKVNYFKKEPIHSSELLQHNDTPGSIAGEGAHFFLLSNQAEAAACAITGISMLQTPTPAATQQAIDQLLANHGLTANDINVLVSGMNGDNRSNALSEVVLNSAAPTTTIATFKQLSGEYFTASGFGLWLCHYIYRKQHIPEQVIHRKGSSGNIRNVLFCNITINGCVSLILLRG
jgi:3-oxoacyl-[acyl-carrier-protein] synthase II